MMPLLSAGPYLGSDWSRVDYIEPMTIAPPLCSQRPSHRHQQQGCYYDNCSRNAVAA